MQALSMRRSASAELSCQVPNTARIRYKLQAGDMKLKLARDICWQGTHTVCRRLRNKPSELLPHSVPCERQRQFPKHVSPDQLIKRP